jgi:hypothetical protein
MGYGEVCWKEKQNSLRNMWRCSIHGTSFCDLSMSPLGHNFKLCPS